MCLVQYLFDCDPSGVGKVLKLLQSWQARNGQNSMFLQDTQTVVLQNKQIISVSVVHEEACYCKHIHQL